MRIKGMAISLLALPALAILAVPNAQAAGCSVTPDTGAPVDAALNACLALPGVVSLAPGEYIVDSGLVLGASNLTLTAAVPASPPNVVLKAGPNLQTHILTAPQGSGVINDTVSFITFDANRAVRQTQPYYQTICTNTTARQNAGTILYWAGVGFTFANNQSINAMCGSGLKIDAVGFTVRDNNFYDLGLGRYEKEADPSLPAGPWSDGITLGYCKNATVSGNTITDATDIGIVSFGGTGCTIQNNTIKQEDMHAFAGLAFHGTGANSTVSDQDSSIINNTVIGNGMMSFGISYGPKPWYTSSSVRFGTVTGNTVSGAVVDLAVEGVTGGQVGNNTLTAPASLRPVKCPSGANAPITYNLDPLDSQVTTTMTPTGTRNYQSCIP
jgi:parallel beta-helix repeat protein